MQEHLLKILIRLLSIALLLIAGLSFLVGVGGYIGHPIKLLNLIAIVLSPIIVINLFFIVIPMCLIGLSLFLWSFSNKIQNGIYVKHT